MKAKTERYFLLGKIILTVLIFYASIQYENAKDSRFIILVSAFVFYHLITILRYYFLKGRTYQVISFLADVCLIYFMEYYSKYLINYFIHSFYILVLIEAAIVLKQKDSLIIGVITVLVSLVKYVQLLYYKNNYSNISQLIFFTLISVLILVILVFNQYYKREKDKKQELYNALLSTHKKLQSYTEQVEELAILKERSRIARDIHDTLGHNMTGIIMEIQMVEVLLEQDIEKAKTILHRAKKDAREGLLQVREVVETFEMKQELTTIEHSMKELIDAFSERTQVNIHYHEEGQKVQLPPMIHLNLYRIIQESMTNAVRHGTAKNIHIKIGYRQQGLTFEVIDDGVGCNDFHKGFGIRGVEQRIAHLNGEITFNTDNGFRVQGWIPVEVKKDDKNCYCG